MGNGGLLPFWEPAFCGDYSCCFNAPTVLNVGTVLAKGLSIHSASKSLLNTSMHLNSFYIGYQKSLDRAVSALRLMENSIAKTGKQRATGSHVALRRWVRYWWVTLLNPIKMPSDILKMRITSWGKLNSKLHDMGAEISAILRESEAINRLLQSKKKGRNTPENPEQQGHLDLITNRSIDRVSDLTCGDGDLLSV